jgi:hypothetical protein
VIDSLAKLMASKRGPEQQVLMSARLELNHWLLAIGDRNRRRSLSILRYLQREPKPR